jgi:ABC-type nickel/cobalt efflux system permease component RcnA
VHTKVRDALTDCIEAIQQRYARAHVQEDTHTHTHTHKIKHTHTHTHTHPHTHTITLAHTCLAGSAGKDIKGVVVRGAGKVFCAGASIKDVTTWDKMEVRP